MPDATRFDELFTSPSLQYGILSQQQRGPGLPSAFVGRDTLMGVDDTVDAHDVFNGPCAASPERDAKPSPCRFAAEGVEQF